MGRKLTAEENMADFMGTHGTRYNYHKVLYTNNSTNVTIICSIHGEFQQTPATHKKGAGCPKCGKASRGRKRRLNTEGIITEFKDCHGDRYDYSRVTYTTVKNPVCIICKTHGEFWQLPGVHKVGHGCPECAIQKNNDDKRSNFIELKQEFDATHNGRYNYENVDYTNAKNKIVITCLTHGDFSQSPETHGKGHGCPKCSAEELRILNTKGESEFLSECKEIHDNYYSYEKTVYTASKDKITVTCPIHGDFEQMAAVHIRGGGCSTCGNEYAGLKMRERAAREFHVRGAKVHEDKYDYSKVVYVDHRSPVIIICPIHGEFQQAPGRHLSGSGCQTCGGHISHREQDIANFLSEWFPVEERNRKILGGKELDVFVPSKSVAVEYNGSYFHSEKFQKKPKQHLLIKTKLCKEKGIRLIHASDYEDQVIIKKTLAHILGIDSERYYARKCKVTKGHSNDQNIQDFLNSNHLQGNVKGCKAYCLTMRGQLVAVMLFSRPSSERGNKDVDRYELRRFSSCCRVVGGASRLLKAFLRDTPQCNSIISYSDSRWFTGEMYNQLGFAFIHIVPPDYRYIKGKLIWHKGRFQRSRLEKRKDIDFRPEETEVQNANRNGWYRIWDCGKKKWELTL